MTLPCTDMPGVLFLKKASASYCTKTTQNGIISIMTTCASGKILERAKKQSTVVLFLNLRHV